MIFADTGPGIQPQQTEKIFEPFQSNFEGGTGLGLAIVYQIVQAHEGKVWARSEGRKGYQFCIAPAAHGSGGDDPRSSRQCVHYTQLADAARVSRGRWKRG